MTMRKALLALGYRELRPTYWLKPAGYHLLSYCETSRTWRNHFMDTRKELQVWESKVWDEHDDPLVMLRTWEAYTRYEIEPSQAADFRLPAWYE